MKKYLFLILLIILPLYSAATLYFMDKKYFLCPVQYNGDIVIRNDTHGNGLFAASRSGKRIHEGIDLLAEIGSPVLAARSGKVISTREKNSGMGNYIIIRHHNGIITIYGHLSKIHVRKNQFVRQGDIIGKVGKTGNANYRDIHAHLHFEVRKNGVPQDPLEYLK